MLPCLLACCPLPTTMDETTRLPPELVSSVLDNLEQPDVLTAASLSRRWRNVARDHRHYYADFSLESFGANAHNSVAPHCTPSHLADTAITFRSNVQHAVDQGARIKMVVLLAPGQDELFDPRFSAACSKVLQALAPALPRIFHLSITVVHASVYDDLATTLQQPAPLLEYLTLSFMANAATGLPVPFPPNFLASDAPMLQHLGLNGFTLPRLCDVSDRLTSLSYRSTVEVPLSEVLLAFPTICKLTNFSLPLLEEVAANIRQLDELHVIAYPIQLPDYFYGYVDRIRHFALHRAALVESDVPRLVHAFATPTGLHMEINQAAPHETVHIMLEDDHIVRELSYPYKEAAEIPNLTVCLSGILSKITTVAFDWKLLPYFHSLIGQLPRIVNLVVDISQLPESDNPGDEPTKTPTSIELVSEREEAHQFEELFRELQLEHLPDYDDNDPTLRLILVSIHRPRLAPSAVLKLIIDVGAHEWHPGHIALQLRGLDLQPSGINLLRTVFHAVEMLDNVVRLCPLSDLSESS